jgi:hypothetical protein
MLYWISAWDVLHLHVKMASAVERCYTAKQLCEMFADKQNQLYLLCTRQILKEVTVVNALLQSQQADVLKLTDDLTKMFASLLNIAVIPTELSKCRITDLPKLPFRDCLMPCGCIHFGYEFEQLASKLQPEVVLSVRERCRDLVIELVGQVQMRLPDNIQTLFMLSSLHPSVATSHQKPSIAPLAVHFKQICTDVDVGESEWRSLQFVTWPAAASLTDSVKFWSCVSTITDADNKLRYGNVSRLALACLAYHFLMLALNDFSR